MSLQNEKLRIGILFVTSNWFRQIGLQGSESSLTAEIVHVGQDIVDRLSEFSEPIYTGILYSEDSAEEAAKVIKEADVQALVVSPLMWCEDQVLRAALNELQNLPILLLTLLPWKKMPDYLPYNQMLEGSGAVGSLQFSGMLKRENWIYQSISGYYRDILLYHRIRLHIRSLLVKEKLKSLTVGVLPFPCDQMSTTFVDDFALRHHLGVQIKYLELSRFREEAETITDKEISEFKQSLIQRGYEILVEKKELKEGICYSLAMSKIVREEGIKVLAINDVSNEMHKQFGLRPSLDDPTLSSSDFVISMEADIAAGLGLYILKFYTGQPPLYSEVLGVDSEANQLLLGHAGYHDSSLADPSQPLRIVNDIEYKNSDRFRGAVSCFKVKPGPVTLINSVFIKGNLKWMALRGVSLPGPYKLEDTVHLLFQSEISVLHFLDKSIKEGASQHWLVVQGDWLDELEILAEWLNIPYLKLYE